MATTLPPTYKKFVVHKLSNDFEEATTLDEFNTSDALQNLKPREIAINNAHWAINASDINYTSGRYRPDVQPPFDCGFESVGQVVAVGKEVTKVKVGQAVAVIGYGAFSEIQIVHEGLAIPIPSLRPEVLPLLVSGLTAYFGLKRSGQMGTGETVLVTAAAGGAGQMAVQLAKLAGNTVIGTCSSDAKAAVLKKLGCDRVINYKTENIGEVLKKEYPQGMNVIFECVGGETLTQCVNNLAVKGRLVIIGSVSNYSSAKVGQSAFGTDSISTGSLLSKSATVTGFFLNHFNNETPAALQEMMGMVQKGQLKPLIESADFEGVSSVAHFGGGLCNQTLDFPRLPTFPGASSTC
ncbi:hypothetical protein DFS34DRAFT_622150 [Phlyctochytrium arcticum]|nr:hypothetical protein DFS34DRAFT_622150 [Phlyctochytrium arcticum]